MVNWSIGSSDYGPLVYWAIGSSLGATDLRMKEKQNKKEKEKKEKKKKEEGGKRK